MLPGHPKENPHQQGRGHCASQENSRTKAEGLAAVADTPVAECTAGLLAVGHVELFDAVGLASEGGDFASGGTVNGGSGGGVVVAEEG